MGNKATLPNPNNRVLWATTSSNAGTTVEAGLPNITGKLGGNAQFSDNNNVWKAEGAFYKVAHTARNGDGVNGRQEFLQYFDASRSNAIYGRSTTVQPPAYRVRYYIKALD